MKKSMNLRLKMNARIADHLIQAVLIFASVFLAFWLTEYRDAQKKSEILKISLQQIASEMQYNHNRIESVFVYYSRLIEQIDSIKEMPNTDWENQYGYELKDWHGIQTPMLRSTAYQTFLNTGISDYAKFEIAKTLADIYNIQSVVERLDNSFFDMATNDRSFTALSKVRHLVGIYSEILPEVITLYQNGGKKWLKEYGYQSEINNTKLKARLNMNTIQ